MLLKPRVVYNTRVMLPSAKKDCVRTTQKSCVVDEFSCLCEARYVGRNTQRLADRIKQHFPTSVRKKRYAAGEQPPRICKTTSLKLIVSLPYDNTLLQIQNMPKHIQTTVFGSLGKQDRLFIYVFWNLFISKLKTQSCVNKKSFFLIGTLQVNNG